MSKRAKSLWNKWVLKNKDTIYVITSIAGIILIVVLAGFFTSEVLIKTNPELGFCPSVFSGVYCGQNYRYVCGDVKEIENSCENAGRLTIESEVYNKGLVLGMDVELEVKLVGADFGLLQSNSTFPRTLGMVDFYVDDIKMSSQTLYKRKDDSFILSQVIHTLKPNDVRRIAFIIPNDFGIYKRPTIVEFILKENGKEIDKKTIFMSYISEERKNCGQQPTTPYPISGRTLSKDGKWAITDVNITVKNMQTGEEQNANSGAYAEYVIDMANFKKCWIDGDVIEIKASRSYGDWQLIGFRELSRYETGIDYDIYLD